MTQNRDLALVNPEAGALFQDIIELYNQQENKHDLSEMLN